MTLYMNHILKYLLLLSIMIFIFRQFLETFLRLYPTATI